MEAVTKSLLEQLSNASVSLSPAVSDDGPELLEWAKRSGMKDEAMLHFMRAGTVARLQIDGRTVAYLPFYSAIGNPVFAEGVDPIDKSMLMNSLLEGFARAASPLILGTDVLVTADSQLAVSDRYQTETVSMTRVHIPGCNESASLGRVQ